MKKSAAVLFLIFSLTALHAQRAVQSGSGSYASYAPLAESKSSTHEGCQAYQTEHRRLYLPDSLLARLAPADGSREGTLTLPTNDWWTYALVNQWTGKLWFYPGWAEATEAGVEIGYPTYWEPTGCEVKWDTPFSITFRNTLTGRKASFSEALVDSWSDFMMSFIMQDRNGAWVRVSCVEGSPLVWFEADGIEMQITNPDDTKYAVYEKTANGKNLLVVALLTDGLTAAMAEQYAWRVPRETRATYEVQSSLSCLDTYFNIYTEDIVSSMVAQTDFLMAFLPHHYYSAENSKNRNVTADDSQFLIEGGSPLTYLSPRGEMRLARGNNFHFRYSVNGMLPFFPAPAVWKEGFSLSTMQMLAADYAVRGTFGADTYWGGKGLTQMMHYMTFAMQTGDTATYKLAHDRLRAALEDWFTYTVGEQNFYFARYPRFGALVGFDTSYDSDTFNDHHFHYGYFVYASAVLCLLDQDFRDKYGQMAREIAMDYACWQRGSNRYPLLRTFNPYCGHSFAGGMGNGGNGDGQESSSEAMQSWGGVWMLGAALGDTEMMNAGIYGYTVEARATAEYWFDRHRRNIDYTKYQHPYCCNLTMQGVGWWTWFSGDPVWMHSIQWLPTSPVLTNYLSEDLSFARWDYTEMYKGKEIGDYEAETAGLGDESSIGNVCLSYLALFDADSAANVWDRMNRMGKALAKNTDTGGITYWLAHSHRSLGEKRFDIQSDYPLACAYTDTLTGATTYAVYNYSDQRQAVHFFGSKNITLKAPAAALTLFADDGKQLVTHTAPVFEKETLPKDPLAWDLPYSNLALHKPVEVSSYENAGTLPVSLTDGDTGSRWGSKHKDGEYAIVDLGEQCYIDHLILRWEAAYASKYEIALSADKQTWNVVSLSSSGGVETVALAEAFARTDKQSRGRYLRLTGLERATTYGTSLYELEAYGRPISGIAGTLFVLALSASDTILTQGQTANISAKGYDALGSEVSCTVQYKITEGNATLSGNRLTVTDYGMVTVSGSSADVTATITFVVMETEQVTTAVVQPEEVTMPRGSEQDFTVSVVNQFGYSTDDCTYSFRADELGDTTLILSCHDMKATAVAHVLPFDDVNLALGKPVTTSGVEGDATAARFAVDGDMDTRWGSRFQDEEWIEVDLEECYMLTKVRLLWEAAYATSYEILVSEDGVEYTVVYTATNAKGGKQELDIRTPTGEAVAAQYVRLLCHTRSSGYGSSIYEMEIYGESFCNEIITQVDIINTDNRATDVPHKFIHKGHIYIQHPSGMIFDAVGKRINTIKP